MDVYQLVNQANDRIKGFIRKTPLEYSNYLSELCGCNVYLKLENLQITGSFKARGGLNKALSLTKEEKEKGIVTASTGFLAIKVIFIASELAMFAVSAVTDFVTVS